MKRRTISKEVTISGLGLHTGVEVELRMVPSSNSSGIVFLRTDIGEEAIIPADISSIQSTNRCTILEKGGNSVSTVEHILAALHGNGIDDVKIEINGPEIPILDGSAGTFVKMIKEAGIIEWGGEKMYFNIEEEFKFEDEETGAEYIVMPSDKLRITALVDFPGTAVSFQFAQLDDISQFNDQFANARTFVIADDLLKLASEDLIKGGDMSNALIIAGDDLTKDKIDLISAKLGKSPKNINENGLGGQQWTSKNEPARHKILDLIGDITLLGVQVNARIIAKKLGHKSNAAFTSLLKRKYIEYKKKRGIPKYDPNVPPVIDTEGVRALLPHRYPFLLVDKIIELTDTMVVGVKNTTVNEEFFQGHFPGNPIFPGVLQMEALAQTGGILALHTVEVPSLWDTYFLKMDKVKFKNKVVPGDTLILKMELISPIRRGIVQMQGTTYVGDKIVSEGELIAQIIKRDR